MRKSCGALHLCSKLTRVTRNFSRPVPVSLFEWLFYTAGGLFTKFTNIV